MSLNRIKMDGVISAWWDDSGNNNGGGDGGGKDVALGKGGAAGRGKDQPKGVGSWRNRVGEDGRRVEVGGFGGAPGAN